MKLIALLLVLASSSSGQDDPGFKLPATLRAHFLLPDGRPAEGVSLRLRGLGADPQRIRRFGAPKGWTDPVAETDAEGRAELRFVPPRAYFFNLEVDLEGYAKSVWSWAEIGLGETIDLGDVRLDPACTIVGTVVDPRGNVLTRGWSGFAFPVVSAESGRGAYSLSEAVDPGSGEFRLAGVAAGKVIVGARGLGVNTETVEVEAVAGVETLVEIVYDGPDLGRRVVVRVRSPFWVFPDASSVRLVAAGGSSRAPETDGSVQASLVFDDVPEGTYRVEIDDSRFEAWAQDGVRPGEGVTASLRPAGRLVLDVVDTETGLGFPHYGVGTVFHATPGSTERELLPDGSPAPDGGILAGVMPIAQTLVVRVPGRPVQRVVLEGPWPDTNREVRVEIGATRQRVGRVTDAAGRPVVGAHVGVLPDLDPSYETDSTGRFRFDDVVADSTLLVICSPWLTATATVGPPLREGQELAIETPASGWVEGRLLLPEGVSATDLALDFEGGGGMTAGDDVGSIWGRISSDGSFRLGPLPAGVLEVESCFRSSRQGGVWTVERAALGTVTVRAGETTRMERDLRRRFPGARACASSSRGSPTVTRGSSRATRRTPRSRCSPRSPVARRRSGVWLPDRGTSGSTGPTEPGSGGAPSRW